MEIQSYPKQNKMATSVLHILLIPIYLNKSCYTVFFSNLKTYHEDKNSWVEIIPVLPLFLFVYLLVKGHILFYLTQFFIYDLTKHIEKKVCIFRILCYHFLLVLLYNKKMFIIWLWKINTGYKSWLCFFYVTITFVIK